MGQQVKVGGEDASAYIALCVHCIHNMGLYLCVLSGTNI